MAIAKKITINDVALAAGVSVSTVSLVLSGKGRISSATGERVNQAIEQLGFVRNRQAASLRGGQSGVIGLIVSDLSKPFYAELTAGLTDALERQGKMVFLTQGGRSGEKMAQRFDTLAAQGVDGVIIAGAIDRGSELRERAAEAYLIFFPFSYSKEKFGIASPIDVLSYFKLCRIVKIIASLNLSLFNFASPVKFISSHFFGIIVFI